jgi:hypothetical protein
LLSLASLCLGLNLFALCLPHSIILAYRWCRRAWSRYWAASA